MKPCNRFLKKWGQGSWRQEVLPIDGFTFGARENDTDFSSAGGDPDEEAGEVDVLIHLA